MIPKGTVVPDSIHLKNDGRRERFSATHYLILPVAKTMQSNALWRRTRELGSKRGRALHRTCLAELRETRMPEVDGNTLAIAIQAVDDKLRALETARDLAGEDSANDFFEEIMAFDHAAHKLKVAYEHALRMADNLPRYETLVSPRTKD